MPRCWRRCAILRLGRVGVGKGGDAALASYDCDPAAVPSAHIGWLDRLQLMHVDAHRVYVHAGVDPEILSGQHGFDALHVVHGYDNHPEGPLLHEGRTNLDMLAWRTGPLMVGVFNVDRPGGPIDFIVVKDGARRSPTC